MTNEEDSDDDDAYLIRRFMAGNTDDMDIHEHAGEVLREEIQRLRSEAVTPQKHDDTLDSEFEDDAGPYRTPAPRPATSEEPGNEYELEILALAYDPAHTQCTIEFKALGAPVFSYSAVRDGPILRATIDLVVSMGFRLGSGGGAALAKSAPSAFISGDFGSALEGPSAVGVPQPPSDEVIARACEKALQRHILEAQEENGRAQFREVQEGLVGRKLKVRV